MKHNNSQMAKAQEPVANKLSDSKRLPRRERDCTRRPPVYANPKDKNFTIILAAITKYLHEQTASYCYLTQEP